MSRAFLHGGASRPTIDRSFIAAHKRELILKATARVVAEKGPRASKVGDIVKEAGIARKTFYDLFGSKQACLQEALLYSAKCLWLSSKQGDLDDRLRNLLTFVNEQPEHAVLHLIHGPVISPIGFRINQGGLKSLFVGASEQTAAFLVGGIEWVLRRHLTDTPDADARLLFNGLRDFVQVHYRPGEGRRLAAVA